MRKNFSLVIMCFLSIFIVGGVIFICVCFLLNNLPYDNSYLDINLQQEKIIISNSLLMTDISGKKLTNQSSSDRKTGYVEFDVKSKAHGKIKYEIYLTKENAELEIAPKFVKVYLTDGNDNSLMDMINGSIPTYYDLKVADSNLSGKLLYSGFLKNGESKKFRLRMWVADTYELKTDTNIFSVKLNIKVK